MAASKRPLKRATNTGRQQPDATENDETEEEELDVQNDDLDTSDDDESDDGPGTDLEETGEDPSPETPTTMQAEEEQEQVSGAPKDGRTFRAGEKIVFKGEKRGGTIVAMETIYRATKHPTSSRWRFHQILVKGSEIPSSKVRELTDDQYESDQV